MTPIKFLVYKMLFIMLINISYQLINLVCNKSEVSIIWLVVMMVLHDCEVLIVCEGSSTFLPEDKSTFISFVRLLYVEG
jgi:hypothetical protein